MKRQTEKSPNGCLWLVITTIVCVISFGIIKTLFPLHDYIAWLLSFGIAVFFVMNILGRPAAISVLKNAVILIIVLAVLKTIGGFLFSLLSLETETATFTPEETTETDFMIENNDTVLVYSSKRSWRDNYGNNYTGSLTVREPDYLRLKDHIKNYVPPAGGNFWGTLYDHIDRTDTPSLDLLLNTFVELEQQHELNRMEFAEMIVSCIQDIPYSFVFQEDCMPARNYDDSIRKVLEKCPECCIGNIMYGIQNPVSFIKNLKGDCDTRTVLIYSILKYFGYDVAILNSDYYKHSILGINLPARGLYKIHNGKKYILWETTAKYFEIGYLSPAYNDVTYWNVVLTSK
jgi:hypothetical protein